jgi:Fic family protein
MLDVQCSTFNVTRFFFFVWLRHAVFNRDAPSSPPGLVQTALKLLDRKLDLYLTLNYSFPMSYIPQFTITPALLSEVERVAALRERIQGAVVDLAWIPALQKDTRLRNVHASTAIEGNPLTLEQVRALEEGRELSASGAHHKREVLNYFAGLRFVEKNAARKRIRQEDILELHRILAADVMDQGEAGKYRKISVRVGKYLPPPPDAVSGLMCELLDWWNRASPTLSPILSSAIIHYRFEAIHPFADGNGRTGRALSLWELYRRGFDTHHIFSVDEYYWEDRPKYYAALDGVRRAGEDLTAWLEYCASGLRQTLERAWLRIQALQGRAEKKLVLRPRQEQLLHLLRDHGSMAPGEIWKALGISRQGAMDLLRPLLDAGLVEKTGGKKTGHYVLKNP